MENQTEQDPIMPPDVGVPDRIMPPDVGVPDRIMPRLQEEGRRQ